MIEEKISKNQYEELKNSYLEKNRTMHSLYSQINQEKTVNRQTFFRLINRIRQEEGLSDYYKRKEKKKINSIVHLDKSPNHYN